MLTLVYVWLGVPQTLGPYVDATTLEGAKQTIALGPVASQLAIKMLGTNGGGFFNANAAHPFENPDAISNLIQMVTIFAIGAALTNVFGRMVGNQRQGWAILAAMGVLFVAGVGVYLLGGSCRQPADACASASTAATWKARKSASASPSPRSSRSSRRPPPAAPSTPCMAASPRSAA